MSEYKIIVAFNFINKVIENLKDQKLISKEPSFDIGDTKLAYRFFKKSIKKPIEDLEDNDTNTAELKRITKGFKVLDIDLLISSEKNRIEVFNKIKEEIAKSGEIVTSTSSDIFVNINGIKLNFIIIDNDETKKYLQYWKSLSIDDEIDDINSMFLIDVHNALCKLISVESFIKEVSDIISFDYDKLLNQVNLNFKKNVGDIINNTYVRKGMYVTYKGKDYLCLAKKENKVIIKSIDNNEQLTTSALDVTPVIIKTKKVVLSPSINGLTLKGKVKVKGQETSKTFDLLDSPIKKLSLLYPENIAKIILGKDASEDDLYSLTKTLNYINKNFEDEKKKKLWNYLINSKRLLRKINNELSEEEYISSLKRFGEKIGINKIFDDNFSVFPIDREFSKLSEQVNDIIYKENKKSKKISKLDGDPSELPMGEYIELLKIMYPHIIKGNLVADNIEINIVEKIDAFYCQFGINDKKEFFMESRDSDEVTKDTYESKFSNNEMFKDTFKFLLENKLLISVLNSIAKEIDDPIKFESELIINPKSPDIDTNIKLKEISYDKTITGNQGSFIVFNAQIQRDNEWIQPNRTVLNKLISNIQDADSNEWRVLSDYTHASISEPLPIGFNFKQLDSYLKNENGISKLKELLKSKMTPEKRRVLDLLLESKKKIQEALDIHSNKVKSNFSKDALEGIIIRAKSNEGKIIEFKSYSEKYIKQKDSNSKIKNDLEKIITELENKIKTNILNLKVTSDISVTQSLYQVSSKDPSIQDPSQIITETLKKIVKEHADFSNIKKESIELLKETKFKLLELKNSVIETKETSDPKIYKNNIDQIKETIDKFKKYSNILKSNLDGIDYLIEVFKSIYKIPLEKILGESFNCINENFSLNDDDFEDTFDFPRGFIGRDGEAIEIGRQSHMSYARSKGYDCDIEYCIGTGNIRWSEELSGMTIGQPLTSEQINIIKLLAKYSQPVKKGETILIDVWNKNQALIGSFETSPTNDIWLAKVIEATKSEKEKGNEKWRKSSE